MTCYFATKSAAGHRKANAERAVRHLKLADADPGLAAWRPQDPQLGQFRRSPEYRAAFGAPIPTGILAVAPFSDHAAHLRAAGLSTFERLEAASLGELWHVGLRGPDIAWVKALVSIGLQVGDDLAAWRVPIVAAFASAGQDRFPTDAKSRTALQEAIVEVCTSFTSSPSEGQVRRWLAGNCRCPPVPGANQP